MTVALPEAILGTRAVGAEMMTGVVTAVSASTLSVVVRGTETDAAYLTSYAAPVAGDLVAVMRQDATWLVLGRIAGVGPNSVNNFSFELDGETPLVPSHWVLYNISGAGSARGAMTGYAPAGDYELAVDSNAAAQDTYVYSDPIAVAPGEKWAVSAFASAVYPPGVAPDATAALYGLWFTTAAGLYPATAAADTLIAQVSNVGAAPVHASVSGVVTVPVGVSFMRVATRSVSPANRTVLFDVVIARKVS